jgi:hypothetical protein
MVQTSILEDQAPEDQVLEGRASIHPQDRVVLAKGPYAGTHGILLRLEEDVAWAKVREWDGRVRSHPVVWLQRRPV